MGLNPVNKQATFLHQGASNCAATEIHILIDLQIQKFLQTI